MNDVSLNIMLPEFRTLLTLNSDGHIDGRHTDL